MDVCLGAGGYCRMVKVRLMATVMHEQMLRAGSQQIIGRPHSGRGEFEDLRARARWWLQGEWGRMTGESQWAFTLDEKGSPCKF